VVDHENPASGTPLVELNENPAAESTKVWGTATVTAANSVEANPSTATNADQSQNGETHRITSPRIPIPSHIFCFFVCLIVSIPSRPVASHRIASPSPFLPTLFVCLFCLFPSQPSRPVPSHRISFFRNDCRRQSTRVRSGLVRARSSKGPRGRRSQAHRCSPKPKSCPSTAPSIGRHSQAWTCKSPTPRS